MIRCGDRVIPLEVKYKRSNNIQIDRSLRSFIERFNPETAFIVTPVSTGVPGSMQVGRTRVSIIPFWRLYYLELP